MKAGLFLTNRHQLWENIHKNDNMLLVKNRKYDTNICVAEC